VPKPSQPNEWLDRFVVAEPPRGEDALDMARTLVAALGAPQHHAPAVHIVGTAGKGSVAARLTARLVGAGFRVATHQSPHVYDVRERFLLDGVLPEWSLVEAAIGEVATGVETVMDVHGRPPTFFAITAALSWVLGRRHDVDVFVTEAGIGGRHDATAVLARPDTITVITHIGLDHTEVLGSTVEVIAAEKAAVMAGRRMAVLGPQADPSATSVVREAASEAGVLLHEVDAGPTWREQADATTDVVAGELSTVLGRALPPGAPLISLGRYEVRHFVGRRVVVDGSHNPDKLTALDTVLAGDVRPRCVIAALGAKKDLRRSAEVLARLGGPVIATTFGTGAAPGPRGHPAADVAAAVRAAGGEAEPANTLMEAVERALALTEPGDTVVVTGSFLILNDVVDAFAAAG
jgi:dihydrofolate synthase/folylpolyglutamate synthase